MTEIPQILHIGFFSIHTYGLTFAGGIIVSFFVGRWAAVKLGIPHEQFDDVAFWAVVVGFVCARAYYVGTYPHYFTGNFVEVFKTWDGGLSIYGGLLGGIAAVAWRAKRLKVSFWRIADAIVIGVPLGQALGRIGNYINHEAFGYPTNVPWKIFIPLADRPLGYTSYAYFQPTFLYELLADLAVFAILFWFFRNRNLHPAAQSADSGQSYHPGSFFGWYLILYSTARFFIEGLRLDSSYILGVQWLRFDQLTAILLFGVGCGILYARRHHET